MLYKRIPKKCRTCTFLLNMQKNKSSYYDIFFRHNTPCKCFIFNKFKLKCKEYEYFNYNEIFLRFL